MKQDGYWARTDQEKVDTFAEYLVRIFISNTREVGSGKKEAIFPCRKSTQCQTTIDNESLHFNNESY